MSKIIFVYKGNNILVQCTKQEKMSSVIDGFYNKSLAPRNSVYFICNGDLLDNELTEDKIPCNESNQKKILVYDLNEKGVDEIIKSNEIICKTCKESSQIDISNYNIILFGCKNKHRIENIKFSEFMQTQFINLSRINCDFCKERNKGNSYNKTFFRCIQCKKNICVLCKELHQSDHYIINHDQKNYVCEEHGEYFHSYCYTCNKNMCTSCENIHNNHAMISFSSMIMDKNVLFQENEKLKNEIEIFNQIISDIINKLNKVKENLEIYYEIHKSIISNINNKFRNFSILYNINEFVNNTIKRDLENIIKDNNTNNQINNIMKMYNKMEAENIDSQINNNDDKIFLYEPDSESDFNLLNNESENLNKNQNYQQPSQQINNINISKSVNIINKNPQNEKQNEESKKRSTVIGVVNELKNILLEEVINKIPLISELKDINGLLNDCKGNSSQINIVKVITSKYKQYRSIRDNGNSFYTCFIYRLFEYISLSRNQSLFDKICQKILNTKNLILQNGYDWDFIKDSFGLFHKEFITCFEQSNISMKTCQLYLDTLFKSEESFNYFNHFIHYCIAAYIKENRILYENYISEKFETWISKVEEIGLEVGQIEILACANYFDIGIKIEYLYPSKVDVVKYPEDKKGEDIFINLLFRPDHYDLLYK